MQFKYSHAERKCVGSADLVDSIVALCVYCPFKNSRG